MDTTTITEPHNRSARADWLSKIELKLAAAAVELGALGKCGSWFVCKLADSINGSKNRVNSKQTEVENEQ